MRKNFIWGKKLLMAAVCFTLSAGFIYAESNPKPFVIPELKSWQGAEGSTPLSGYIIVKNKSLQKIAQALQSDYQEMFGKALTVTSRKPQPGDIVIGSIKDNSLGKEGYKISIGRTVNIEAPTAQGVFWATRTLLQMSEQSADRALPKGTIVDVPEYQLRGFMMDCGRKFIPMDYLRSLTKIMAYYKMNTLQIHLNDNGFVKYFDNDWNKTQAAFRLECETYPGLTAQDGSYSKKEFIDLQELAENNYVEIIPEIDAPAHSLAFTQYKPELGSKKYGMDHLDLFNPETYTFMDGLFKEYLEGKNPVFRGKRVHIGTDEYSNAEKEVVEKFRAFTDHYIRYVESFGKQAVVWGALTHAQGETPVKVENVVMDCWYNGYAQPKEMKKQGYQLISIPDGLVYIVPGAGYYYDYLNCEMLYNKYTPALIGDLQFEENDPSILGGMFAVWNDHPGNGITVKDIHHRLFPAMQTLSTKCWSGKNTSVPYKEFDRLRLQLSEAPGVNELARHGKPGTTVIEKAVLAPEEELGIKEIGYNYSITFTVEGKEEQKGTELLRSDNAVFYLSDPQDGKLGFEHEGYLNKFNYRIEKGKKAVITIEGNNMCTRLLVNGKLREELGKITLYGINEKNRAHYQVGNYKYEPTVYASSAVMYYHRTLVFPLQKAGRFESRITDFSVMVTE